jgi:hypothetical protein
MPLGVDARLSPEFGRTTIYIQRPDGRTLQYTPLIYREGTPELRLLAPAGSDVAGADRYSEPIALTFDQHGFIFGTPGDYLVRAAYAGSGDLMILSNIHRVRIGNPISREEDRLAQDYFSQEVGMALYLSGSQSPFLRRGMEHLEALAERYATSPIGAKAAFVVANSVARPFFRIQDPERPVLTQTHTPDPARALALTQPALELYQRTDARAHNLGYHRLVRSRAGYLAAVDQVQQALQELGRLRSDLAARGVNQAVLDNITAYSSGL